MAPKGSTGQGELRFVVDRPSVGPIKSTSLPSASSGIGRFALNTRTRATRASSTKTRSGCWTCKQRHVKCDETKPACKNCLTWRGSKGRCGGYGSRPATDVLVDDRVVTTNKGAQKPRSYDAIIRELIEGEEFSTDLEKSYFDDWIRFAMDTPSGIFPAALWVTTLPQLTRRDKPLRYGAMAIGALIKTAAESTQRRPLQPGPLVRPCLSRSSHYEDAIAHYCRALQLQARQQAEGNDDANLWAAILSSALFSCFETLRGERHSALKHTSHGITLVTELLRRYIWPQDGSPKPDNFVPAPKSAVIGLLRDFERLESQCRTFSSAAQTSNKDWPSSSSHIRSTMQLVTGHPTYTSAAFYQTKRYVDMPYTGEDIPERIGSLLEARGLWEKAQRRIWGYFPSIFHAVDAIVAAQGGADGVALLSDEELELKVDALNDDAALIARREGCVALARRLDRAFGPLFESCMARRAEDRLAYRQALGLKIQLCFTTITAETPRFSSLEQATAATPLYASLVSLVHELLSETTSDDDETDTVPRGNLPGRPQIRGYSMDMGQSWQMLVVALGCRDAGVRARAVEVLRKFPRTDAFFNSTALHAVAARAVALEEEDMRGDEASAVARLVFGLDADRDDAEARSRRLAEEEEARWRRLRRREFAFGDDGKTAILRWLRRDPATGEVAFVEDTVDFTVPDSEGRWTRRPYSAIAPLLSDI